MKSSKINKNNKKEVYVALCADILHHGHIKILKKASQYGNVTVGLLNDKAISSYKALPVFNFKQRKKIIESISYVHKVVEQKTLDYKKNLMRFKPDFVVHGDDWKQGIQKKTREEVLKCLKLWNGKLIEPRYTKGISSSLLKKKIAK